MSDHTVKDDRVLKPTRVISVVIIPVLTAAFVILYLFPTRTGQLWAWETRPTMTAMVMGGGYLSGAYFFRAFRDRGERLVPCGSLRMSLLKPPVGRWRSTSGFSVSSS
jgi:hypothetical protein